MEKRVRYGFGIVFFKIICVILEYEICEVKIVVCV